jgi:hypothetical protein
MKIIDSKLQGNVLQEFTDDYLEKHKELIKYVKEETKKQLTLTDVSQHRELLIDFSKKIMFGEDWTPPLPYEQMVDDYLKGN